MTAGAAALVKAANKALTALQIKAILMQTVDQKPGLVGKVVTNGMTNVSKAVLAAQPKHRVSNTLAASGM